MENKQIPAKTLITVLAAQIKEDAETIAKAIVNQAKTDNIAYELLVQNYVLKKNEYKHINVSSLIDIAFAEVKDLDKLRSVDVEVKNNIRLTDSGSFEKFLSNQFTISLESTDKDKEHSWLNLSVSESGSSFNIVLQGAINRYKKNILNITEVEVVIDSEIISE